MPSELKNIVLNEVSLCKEGANAGAKMVLAKTKSESNEMPNEDLQKQIDELKAERDKLQGELDKAKAEVETPKVEKVEDKIEKLDPELKEIVEKAKADAAAAKEEAKKTADALAKATRNALAKAISDRLAKTPLVIEKAEDMVDSLTDMAEDVREKMFKAFERAETVAKKGEEMFKELGSSKGDVEGSAKSEIDKQAKEYAEKHSVSIQKARIAVRDANPELAKRERDEEKRR